MAYFINWDDYIVEFNGASLSAIFSGSLYHRTLSSKMVVNDEY